MTNPHEPSYYEIALTNRQVVVAFVILLLCLVSAFFSGLWIGRESAARAQQQIVQATPPGPVEPPEGQELEELEFFDAEQAPGSADPEPPRPVREERDTTLLEDLGDPGSGGTPERTAPPAPPEPEAEAAEPAREPEPAPSPAVPARPRPSPAPAEPRLAAGQVVIQVFSSAELDQAEKVRDRLVRGGQAAFLSPVEVGGRTMYRVRIGPFDSRAAAQGVAEKVRREYKLDTWVTE